MGKRIILGGTGSIAAYKLPWIVREFQRHQWEVRVVLSASATSFVSPVVLENLTKTLVPSDIFDNRLQTLPSWHIQWARWADVYLIVPCSLSTIGKLCAAIADSPVTLLAFSLAEKTPIGCVPAMDHEMWEHPITQEKIKELQGFGIHLLPPTYGSLASGLEGWGRLPEIPEIIAFAEKLLTKSSSQRREPEHDTASEGNDKPTISLDEAVEKLEFDTALEWAQFRQKHSILKGKRILITAGPTYEFIDPVRFIGNPSTGMMGYRLAQEAALRGAKVTVVSGPTHLEVPAGVECIRVRTAEEMYEHVQKLWSQCDIFIGAAAVADFAPTEPKVEKIKKEATQELVIRLKRTPDILSAVGRTKRSDQYVVGFALETGENAIEVAKQKLQSKNCDFVVLNYADQPQSGFGIGQNTITLITADGEIQKFPPLSKAECAQIILDKLEAIIRSKQKQ